jgi:hypothetical protein
MPTGSRSCYSARGNDFQDLILPQHSPWRQKATGALMGNISKKRLERAAAEWVATWKGQPGRR